MGNGFLGMSLEVDQPVRRLLGSQALDSSDLMKFSDLLNMEIKGREGVNNDTQISD